MVIHRWHFSHGALRKNTGVRVFASKASVSHSVLFSYFGLLHFKMKEPPFDSVFSAAFHNDDSSVLFAVSTIC